jgi:hemoglobin
MRSDELPSLYERLGGVYNIAIVVDDFIDRVMTDDRLNKNPAVQEAHHRVSPPGFKYLVTEMMCWASGGPQQYSGRAMEDVHHNLAITEDEWTAFMDDLHQSLARFHVPAAEEQDIVTIIEGTKDAVVTTPLRSGPPSP